jgi:hypothetical protein
MVIFQATIDSGVHCSAVATQGFLHGAVQLALSENQAEHPQNRMVSIHHVCHIIPDHLKSYHIIFVMF